MFSPQNDTTSRAFRNNVLRRVTTQTIFGPQSPQTEKKQARGGSKVREPWSLVNLNDKDSRAFRNNVLHRLFSVCERRGVLRR